MSALLDLYPAAKAFAPALPETERTTSYREPAVSIAAIGRGWPVVLVRYGSADPERVRHLIRQACAQAAAKTKVRKRKA